MDDQRDFCNNISFSVYPGCGAMFFSEFGIIINEKPPIPITLFSRNYLPNATILDIPRPSIYYIDKEFEYDCLRELYKYVHSIRITDEDIKPEDVSAIKMKLNIEKNQLKTAKRDRKKMEKTKARNVDVECAAGDSEFIFSANGKVSLMEKQIRKYSAKMLQLMDEELENGKFVVLDYADEYPRAIEILNFMTQQGFVQALKNEEVLNEYLVIYNRHILEKFLQVKSTGKSRVGGRITAQLLPDNSLITALPFMTHMYMIDFGDIQIGETCEKILKIVFHGNCVAASIRTECNIPNFEVQFLQTCETEKDFKVIHTGPKGSIGKYKNRHRRAKDQKMTPSTKRYHSFDFSQARMHTRNLPTITRRRCDIIRHYKELNSTKRKDEKSSFSQSEIRQIPPFKNYSNIFQMKISLSPKIGQFDLEIEFDEIIYLDVSELILCRK